MLLWFLSSVLFVAIAGRFRRTIETAVSSLMTKISVVSVEPNLPSLDPLWKCQRPLAIRGLFGGLGLIAARRRKVA